MSVSTSWIEMANDALNMLGSEETLTSFTQPGKAASLIEPIYQRMANLVVASHQWKFASKRAILAPDSTEPEWKSGNDLYYFTLPADYLNMVMVEDDAYTPWRIENNKIIFHSNVLRIIYTAAQTDASRYHPLAAQAISAKIALRIAPSYTQSKEITNDIRNEYKEAIIKAAKLNAFESSNPYILTENHIRAHYGPRYYGSKTTSYSE